MDTAAYSFYLFAATGFAAYLGITSHSSYYKRIIGLAHYPLFISTALTTLLRIIFNISDIGLLLISNSLLSSTVAIELNEKIKLKIMNKN